MIDLTPSMTRALSTIGNRGASADELHVNGCVLKRLAELGFLNIDMPREKRCPPIYSLSQKGEGAAAILNATPRWVDREGAVARIKRKVAEHYRIPPEEMVSARRSRKVARPRQVAMYLTKQLTPKSLPDIGRNFGNRDHTTVIHAVRTVERLRAESDKFSAEISDLAESLAQ